MSPRELAVMVQALGDVAKSADAALAKAHDGRDQALLQAWSEAAGALHRQFVNVPITSVALHCKHATDAIKTLNRDV